MTADEVLREKYNANRRTKYKTLTAEQKAARNARDRKRYAKERAK